MLRLSLTLYGYPCFSFLDPSPLMAEVLSFCVFSQSYWAPDRLLVASAISLKVAHRARVWSLLCLQTLACLLPVLPTYQSLLSPLYAQGAHCRVLGAVGLPGGHLGSGDLWVVFPLHLVGRLPESRMESAGNLVHHSPSAPSSIMALPL